MRLVARRSAAALLTAVLSLALTGSAVAASGARSSGQAGPARTKDPAGTTNPGWGWAVVRNPAASYTLPSTDGADSSGQHPAYVRLSAGHSDVTFPGISNGFQGVPIVTALSAKARTCNVDDWSSVGAPEVLVSCVRLDGTLVDTAFSVNLALHGDVSTRIAYLYASCGSDGCNIGPSYNPSGMANTAQRTAAGSYVVGLPDMSGGTGNVQISAVSILSIACRATSFDTSTSTLLIGIECRDQTGALAESGFTLEYTQGRGLTGVTGRKAAFLLATRPKISSYHPAAGLWFSSAGTAPTVARSGIGSYVITLAGMPKGGSAQVTPYLSGKARCNLTSIRDTGTPQRIGVHCYSPSGAAKDTRFSLTYTH